MALCGVLPEERTRRQPFEIDVDVSVDFSRAGSSDALADTVDYGALCALIDQLAVDEQYSLLEKFATRVADVVLATPLVSAVTVTVRKLRPPVPQHLSTSGVRIHRTKS
jgi:dihydroneopterin aldolase